jgi:hypothetical protein
MNFEINLETIPKQTTPLPVETITNSSTNISVETFHVFKINSIDTPPSSWQQWLNPAMFQEQGSLTNNGLF